MGNNYASKEGIARYLREEGLVDTGTDALTHIKRVLPPERAEHFKGKMRGYTDGVMGVKDFFESIGERVGSIPFYDLLKSSEFESTREQLERLLKNNMIGEGKSVLDIGCATGLEAVYASLVAGDKTRVVGLDFSEKMLEFARERANRRNLRNIYFVNRDLSEHSDLGLFDSVLCMHTLNDAMGGIDRFDADYVIGEIMQQEVRGFSNRLAPTGKLLVTFPEVYSTKSGLGYTISRRTNQLAGAFRLTGLKSIRTIPAKTLEKYGSFLSNVCVVGEK